MLVQPVFGPYNVVAAGFTGAKLHQAQGQSLARQNARQRVKQIAWRLRLRIFAVGGLVLEITLTCENQWRVWLPAWSSSMNKSQ